MEKEQKLIELGEKVWRFRRENGLTKKISSELQLEAARLCKSGITAYSIGKALGVPRNTISDWVHRHEKLSVFSEASIIDEKPEQTSFQVKVTSEVQGCHVEITGKDFSLLQKLLRRLEN